MMLRAAGGGRATVGSSSSSSSSSRRHSRQVASRISRTAPDAAPAPATAARSEPTPLDGDATPAPAAAAPTSSRRHSLAAATALLTLAPAAALKPSPAHAARTVVVGPGGALATPLPALDAGVGSSSGGGGAFGRPEVAAEAGEEVLAYEHGVSLAIVALRGSVPAQWVLDFRRTLGKFSGFSLDQRPQLEGVFDELAAAAAALSSSNNNTKKAKEEKKNSAARADVVTVGDAWLAAAVRKGLVQPIPGAQRARWWRRLPERWRRLARRDPRTGAPSASGEVYACPYRWGAMLVAYKKPVLEKRRRPGREHLERALAALPFGEGAARLLPGRSRLVRDDDDQDAPRPIRDWSDLLQPALRGRVAFSESPRELVAIALKTLGLPFNATAADAARQGVSRATLRERVLALRAQARLFSDRDHVRALGTGDVYAVVGTSADLVPLAERAPSVALVAPVSGTALWADLWAVPTGAKGGHLLRGPAPTLPSWLEFCTAPARVGTLGSLRTGATPLLLPPEQGVDGGGGGGGGLLARAAAFLTRRQGGVGRGGRRAGDDDDDEESDEPWRLSNRNGYLPPRAILARSEFLAPLDAETAEMYAYALEK